MLGLPSEGEVILALGRPFVFLAALFHFFVSKIYNLKNLFISIFNRNKIVPFFPIMHFVPFFPVPFFPVPFFQATGWKYANQGMVQLQQNFLSRL